MFRACALLAALTFLPFVRADDEFPAAKRINELVEQAIADGKLPGAVVIVGHQGRIVFHHAYGRRAVEPVSENMTEDTVFDLASLTKVVATTPSIMKLVDAGKIRVDDKVTKYLPEFQNGKSPLTIRDLMTHYSGLRPDLDLVPPWSGYETGIAKALHDVPAGPPRARFVYSDINFVLLGEIVRRVSGEPLDTFAREHIYDPLGMKDTGFLPGAELLSRIAPTERQENGVMLRGVVHDPTARFMGGVAGHAGLFGTASDLAKYCQMLLNQGAGLFDAATVRLFTSPASPGGGKAVRGLGWDINSSLSGNRGELFPDTGFGHTGFTGTSIWIDPQSETYVILLANAVHPAGGKPITSLRRAVATAVASAVGYGPHVVKTGLDVLEDEGFRTLLGKRVGLITNQTGLDRKGRRNVDVMLAAGVKVTTLFSPEHGIAGVEDKQDVAGGIDKSSGVRVVSLFAGKTQRPSADMLRNLDVLVFDIADIGARFYTYSTTMAYAMEEAARAHVPFIVLDRPNPITGLHVERPMLDARNESFIGYFPMPVRHGMTMGELATMFNAENHIGADLRVVQMDGWHRSDWFDATGLEWVDPSPNMRSLQAALLYPAVAMLEYSKNYSVGRGSPAPFEWVHAPFIKGGELAAYLNGREISGVRCYPVHPDGVHFLVTNRDLFDAGRFGIELAMALRKLYPGAISFEEDRRLIGSDAVVGALSKGDDARGVGAAELAKFLEVRARYLIYR